MPKLSICCITYNHAAFVKQALDSFLAQQTKFEIEIIISDDASRDETVAIINDCLSKTNIKRKVFVNSTNIGVIPNFLQALKACTGEYIALCEGDDFWTDAAKLQKQVDFLEANSDYSIVHHPVNIIREGEGENFITDMHLCDTITIETLALGNQLSTLSVVFRKNFKVFPEWMIDLPIGDYPLHLFNSQFGKVKFLREVMATYRIHSNGIYESKTSAHKLSMYIKTLNGMIGQFSSDINDRLKQNQLNAILSLYDLEPHFKLGYFPQCFSLLISDHKQLSDNLTKMKVSYEKSWSYKIGKFLLAPIQLINTFLSKL